MRLRIWGRLAAAVVGAVALAGSASAQTTARAPIVVPQQVLAAQPAPGPTAPTVPAIPTAPPAALPPAGAAATPVAPAPGATVVTGNGGCTNCGTAGGGTSHRGFVMGATGGYIGSGCSFGKPCGNGCGSLRSDLGIVFGSCRTFFAPCGPGLFGSSCNRPTGGTGSCAPFNPCNYDSYLNH